MCNCPCQLWALKGSAATCFWGYLLKKMRLKELFRVRRNLDVFESCEDGVWVPAGCSCVEVLGDGSPAQGKWLLWGRGAGFCVGRTQSSYPWLCADPQCSWRGPSALLTLI